MFIRYMSHEIRTPLNAAYIGAQILKQEIIDGECVEEILTTLGTIISGFNSCIGVLDKMLTSDAVESGTLALSREKVLIKQVLDEGLELSRIEVMGILLFLILL